jgi:hypothetical protein
MASYRLYFLNSEKAIAHATVFDCPSDAEAIELALEVADGRPMELWNLARFVKLFPSDAGDAAAGRGASAPWVN